MTKNNDTYTVTFTSPKGSDTFDAELGPKTTGVEAVAGLVEAEFLAAPTATISYALTLQRTNKILPPSVALVESGVKNGDVVLVTETSSSSES